MTYDEALDYVEDNYDPRDFKDFDSFVNTVQRDFFKQRSNSLFESNYFLDGLEDYFDRSVEFATFEEEKAKPIKVRRLEKRVEELKKQISLTERIIELERKIKRIFGLS